MEIMLPDGWIQSCTNVLDLVFRERIQQFQKYGTNSEVLDGTGPNTRWALPVSSAGADALEEMFRADYEEFEDENGLPTWVHLVREEMAEAFKETDPKRLTEELIQVAALCVSWVEQIHQRNQ